MVTLNMEDGTFRKFNLQDPSDLAAFNQLGRDHRQLARIRALWIATDLQTETMPIPKGFRRFRFWATLVPGKVVGEKPKGERVVVQADEISVTFTAYYGPVPRMTRIDVQRTGKLRWSPELTEGGQ